MGVPDRRLFTCPAVIPHDPRNGLFAGISSLPSRYGRVLSRARIRLGRDDRGFAQFGMSRPGRNWPAERHYSGPSSKGLAERFLEERKVCDEAAGRHQLGELASPALVWYGASFVQRRRPQIIAGSRRRPPAVPTRWLSAVSPECTAAQILNDLLARERAQAQVDDLDRVLEQFVLPGQKTECLDRLKRLVDQGELVERKPHLRIMVLTLAGV
jgi:hypothetical protein